MHEMVHFFLINNFVFHDLFASGNIAEASASKL